MVVGVVDSIMGDPRMSDDERVDDALDADETPPLARTHHVIFIKIFPTTSEVRSVDDSPSRMFHRNFSCTHSHYTEKVNSSSAPSHFLSYSQSTTHNTRYYYNTTHCRSQFVSKRQTYVRHL